MRKPASQWINCLAILLGGIALLLAEISPSSLLNFLIAGLVLGFLWPERSWRWGLWLSIPALVLGLTTIFNSASLNEVPQSAALIAEALISGALTGWLGSKYSPRKLPFGGLR